MTKVVRSLPAETKTELYQQHTQPFHIVRILVGGTALYLSEGPEMLFDGNLYLEGMVRVSGLSWTGEGAQSCNLEILNHGNLASMMFFTNVMADADVTVWSVFLKADNTFTDPVLYAQGSVEDTELTRNTLRMSLVTAAIYVKFFPNIYMGSANFNHIPAEGTVVFWNATTYVLERDYG